MSDIPHMSRAHERFDHLYETVSAQGGSVVVADLQAGAPEDISLEATEGIGPDNLLFHGYRAIGMLTVCEGSGPDSTRTSGTVELYKEPGGKLTAYFSDGKKISTTAAETNGYQHYVPIPPHCGVIAINSALLAMEQALGLNELPQPNAPDITRLIGQPGKIL